MKITPREDQYIMLSALQHYLFCQRQCALIHVEQVWAENQFTAEGNALHEKAHEGSSNSRGNIRTLRTLHVASSKLRATGQCDIVEFHKDGTILPIEYKRGKPKSHRADEVQLCAQAICLEEMLDVEIARGNIFYGQQKRRTPIDFDPELRELVSETAKATHAMIAEGKTPIAEYEKKKCEACSLIEICQPKMKSKVKNWFNKQLTLGELI